MLLGEFAQHVLEDATVAEVISFPWCVDAHPRIELDEGAVFPLSAHMHGIGRLPRFMG